MASLAAFDSKEFRRVGAISEFIAVIGAAVRVKNLTTFNDTFDESLARLSSEHPTMPHRKVHKSYELSTYLGRRGAQEFAERLIGDLAPEIDRAVIYYTILPPSKLPQIYAPGRGGIRRMDPIDFLKQLNNAYPHLSAWKYLQRTGEDKVLLDYFQGEFTGAWREIAPKRPVVYAHGDACNRAICVADMMVNVADIRLEDQNLKLNEESLREVFEEGPFALDVGFIGQPDLKHIVPLLREPLNLYEFVKEPVHFYVSERRPELMETEDATYLVERSPAFGHLLDMACEQDGCVKRYQERQDGNLLPKAGVIGYVGPKGKEVAEFLAADYGLEALDLSAKIKGDKLSR